MKSFLKWLRLALLDVAASESGELLSVRDKAYLLDAKKTPPAKPAH